MKGLFIPDITAEMFRNGCLESIEALMAEGEIYDIEYSSWISVEQKLPQKGEQVLCCNKHGSVFTSAITNIEKDKNKKKYIYFGHHYDVIAWIPLPKPYKPQESEVNE